MPCDVRGGELLLTCSLERQASIIQELQVKEEALAQYIQKAEHLEDETASQREIVGSRGGRSLC